MRFFRTRLFRQSRCFGTQGHPDAPVALLPGIQLVGWLGLIQEGFLLWKKGLQLFPYQIVNPSNEPQQEVSKTYPILPVCKIQ